MKESRSAFLVVSIPPRLHKHIYSTWSAPYSTGTNRGNANVASPKVEMLKAYFISKKTPNFFAIDNIENGLNLRLCRFKQKNRQGNVV